MSNLISLQELKANIDILEVAQRYCELKKINATTYKAVINPIRDEKTSSLHFYTNTQKFFDFGSDERGDAFDLIAKCENISLADAYAKFRDDPNYAPRPQPIREKLQTVQEVVISREQLQNEFNRFEKINPSNPKHKEELLSICPYWLYDTAQKENAELFLRVTRFDSRNNTLVAGWYKTALPSYHFSEIDIDSGFNFERDFEIVTYKRRRLNGGKWINRKDSKPNSIAFSRVYSDDKPVYVVEGARDALTSILLGLNFVAIPTTSYKNIEDMRAYIKPYDEVIFICEDMQGYKAMKLLSESIEAHSIVLKTFVTKQDEKIDLSDFVMSCKCLEEVQNAIRT